MSRYNSSIKLARQGLAKQGLAKHSRQKRDPVLGPGAQNLGPDGCAWQALRALPGKFQWEDIFLHLLLFEPGVAKAQALEAVPFGIRGPKGCPLRHPQIWGTPSGVLLQHFEIWGPQVVSAYDILTFGDPRWCPLKTF